MLADELVAGLGVGVDQQEVGGLHHLPDGGHVEAQRLVVDVPEQGVEALRRHHRGEDELAVGLLLTVAVDEQPLKELGVAGERHPTDGEATVAADQGEVPEGVGGGHSQELAVEGGLGGL